MTTTPYDPKLKELTNAFLSMGEHSDDAIQARAWMTGAQAGYRRRAEEEDTMKLQRLPSGRYCAFCAQCGRGAIMRSRCSGFAWAIQHQQRHQQGAAQ